MNYVALTFWLSVCNAVFMAVGAIVVWWTNREKVTNKKFDGHETRIIRLEDAVAKPGPCPQHTEITANYKTLQASTEQVGKQVERLEGRVQGRLEGIGNALDLIQQHLLSGGK